MDRTNNFKTILQNLKHENKAINEILSHKSIKNTSIESKFKPNINGNKEVRDEWTLKVKGLVQSITDMKTYLIDIRKDYINIYSPLLSLASMMTDRERDQIDEDVEQFIKLCNEKAIKCMRIEVKRRGKSQLSEHQKNVINLVEEYLKTVCAIHSQQKAIRIKRSVEKQRLIRLGNIVTNRNFDEMKPNSDSIQTKQNIDSDKENRNLVSNGLSEQNETYDRFEYNIDSRVKAVNSSDESSDETYHQLELSRHELQVFEEENKHLYKEMNSLSDEVMNIETKVIEIARLQQIFTDNVLKQEIDLNKLNDLTVSSTENIRGGNEQLREAMKKNAGFRVWILFFITTLAFTILFLDWYND